MKKICVFIIIATLFALPVFAFQSAGPEYEFEFKFTQGWNLIPFGGIELLKQDYSATPASVTSTLSKGLQGDMYLYNPVSNKYIVFKDDDNEGNDAKMEQVYSYAKKGYIHFSSLWVYLKEDTEVSVPYYTTTMKKIIDSMEDEAPGYKMRMSKGWNMISVTPHFQLGELGMGTCHVQKSYLWNPFEQNWQSINWVGDIMDGGNEEMYGYGVAVKVSNDCVLSTSSSAGGPPSLPN